MQIAWFKQAGQGEVSDREIQIPITFTKIFSAHAHLLNPNASQGTGNESQRGTTYKSSILSSISTTKIVLRRDGGNDGNNLFLVIGT